MAKCVTVKAENGVDFTARRVDCGDTYGLNNCLMHTHPDPLIEFYDAAYPHTEHGQFVSRYSFETLAEGNGLDNGLCLDGGNAERWSIDAAALRHAVESIATDEMTDTINLHDQIRDEANAPAESARADDTAIQNAVLIEARAYAAPKSLEQARAWLVMNDPEGAEMWRTENDVALLRECIAQNIAEYGFAGFDEPSDDPARYLPAKPAKTPGM